MSPDQPLGPTRREMLARAGLTLAGGWGVSASGVIAPLHAAAQEQDPYAALRARWYELLTGGEDYDMSVPEIRATLQRIDADAGVYYDTLRRGADRSHLWDDLDFTGTDREQAIDVRDSYQRLEQLALAYSTRGSAFHADADLLGDTINALDWMNVHKYHEDEGGYGNWFIWQIAVPLALNDGTTMLYDELGPDRVARYMSAVDRWRPSPSGEGANRIWTATVVAVRAALVGDEAKLVVARDGISPVLEYVTSGNGFYEDGSFIQHNRHPYTGGYGIGVIRHLSRLLYLLHDSPWTVTDPNLDNVFTWVTECFEPWLYKGSMMSSVRGRDIARYSQQDHVRGHDTVRAIMATADFGQPADAVAFRGLVKYTIEQDEFRSLFDETDIYSVVQALTIAGDPEIPARTPPVRNKMFPMMDRVVHRRPGFAFAVSMSSSRIFSYESINSENLRGWYTGDGMHYLYNDDLAHYDDGFWATVDHHRLPGTTVPVRPRADSSGRNYLSPHQWVGGASLDDIGAAGMEFQSFDDEQLRTFHLRLASDGEAVSAAWSPDGSRWVEVGAPASIASFAEPHVGVYAARGLTDADSIDVRFTAFRLTCDTGCVGASDEFDGDELDQSRWTWIVREDPSSYRLEDGALVLVTDRGEFDRGEESTRNIVLQPAPDGVWEADVTVSFVPQAPYQHAGIVLYQDDQNFVRIHRIMFPTGDRFTFVEQRNGGSAEQQVHSFPSDELEPGELLSTPRGRKSWFMLQDRIVFAGAGITSTSGDAVETIVENRKLAGASAQFVVDGQVQTNTDGWRHSFDQVAWAHLQGPEPGDRIGYVFPNNARLEALRENRVGSWADVNDNPAFLDEEPLERRYLTMWFDHGIDPADADYSWILLPGASTVDVRAYATRPDIELIANDQVVQAVRSGGIVVANVWTPDPVTFNGLTCIGQASVIVKQTGHQLAVAISDPTHTGDHIQLQLRRRATGVLSHDPRIQIDSLSPAVALTVDVADAQGRTAVAHFSLR